MIKQKGILFLAITFTGFYALIMQVTYIREILVVCYGNELCLGLILGFWLFGISAGAYGGSKISIRVSEPLKLFFFLAILLTFVFSGLIYFIRTGRTILEVPPGEYMPFLKMVLFIFLAVSPGSAFIGFTFPLICLAKANDEGKPADGIANVFIFEAFGSILGGLLFTFLFVPYFSSFTTITIANSIAFAVLAVLSAEFQKKSSRVSAFLIPASLCIVLLLCLNFGLIKKIEDFTVQKRWTSFTSGLKLLSSVDSKYQNIAIGKSENQYSLFLNGNYTSSFPDEYQQALFAHLAMAEHPNPKNLLLIGGGVTGIIKNILRYEITGLDYLELDFREIESLKDFLPEEDRNALADRRLAIFPFDGRYYVKNCRKTYDLIILNLPDPSTAMINRFYTREFFSDLKKLLTPEGVIVTSITSEVNYFGKEILSYTGSLYKTLKEAFRFVLVSPGEKNIFFSSDSNRSITFDRKILASRFSSKNISSYYFTPFHFELLLPRERVEFARKKLSELKDIPVNTDEKPVTYFYSLLLWDRLSGWKKSSQFQFADYVKFLSKIKFYWYLLPLLFFLMLRLAYLSVSKKGTEDIKKFNSAFSIFAAGFAGMAFSIILIFAFQNIFGYVYQKIGLIVATFMLGLAIGGYFIKTLLTKKIQAERILFANLILIIIFSLSLSPLILFFTRVQAGSLLPVEISFSAFLFIAGLLTGTAFPCASKTYFSASGNTGKTAGIINSADHLGAFLSAILTGVFFVPIFGISKTCLFIAVLNFVAVGMWLVSQKK
ncbi:MAG: hypothetical protein A3C43_03250 [Candidatus Schekmanbacteria bacterium RIFCSPHIGHO2_02_FULL_38_11]|nr:MAG: hypothetical protein A3H37_07335 [Candidatus Schekmanbacteria bacterium RIFCSPLOWO2_02_FULL_38_14]OGL54295.1 MAG: hypothetical protein A3C43_03250 [Candidatus Schekmanbacteria bacterium RIFCSPHIGHO2_02_FULL_38_11]